MDNNINYYKSYKIRKKDFYFAILVAFMFFHNSLLNYFSELIEKTVVISDLQVFFYPLLYFSLFVLSYKHERFKWIKLSDFMILLFFIAALTMTYIIFPANWPYISEYLYSDILLCIPFFVLGISLNLDNETYKVVNFISFITIIANIFYMIYYFNSGRSLVGSHGEDYSMHRAYLILLSALMAIDYTFKSRKILPLLITIAGIIYVFSMGTRGPIVIVAVFIAICIWKYSNLKSSYKIFLGLIFCTIIILFISTSIYMDILLDIKDALFNAGASTRIVDYLINGEIISNSSGRNDIYNVLISKLNHSPILGYGIYGEYAIGFRAGAHNIYLQILFNFGYPIGILLISSYVNVIMKGMLASKNTIAHRWIIMFACIVFIRGIIGSSYFNYNVFFLLGFCLKTIREESFKKHLTYKSMECKTI